MHNVTTGWVAANMLFAAIILLLLALGLAVAKDTTAANVVGSFGFTLLAVGGVQKAVK